MRQKKKITAKEATEILRDAPGLKVVDEGYPMPIDCAYDSLTYVGRIREDISCEKGLVLWIVSDNLLKGAALNAVQIAEELIMRKYL